MDKEVKNRILNLIYSEALRECEGDLFNALSDIRIEIYDAIGLKLRSIGQDQFDGKECSLCT